MTIASAITAAQGRVADCYTSVDTMGGTLPEVQNLTNLPAAIESIPQGGGTYVLAHDTTGLIWPDDDDKKVLVNYGQDNAVKSEEFTTTGGTNNRNYLKPVWFDNDTFSIFSGFSTSCYKYNYNGTSWEREVVTIPFSTNEYYIDFKICDKGMLATSIYTSDNSHNYGCNRIVDSGGNVSTISGANAVYCYGATIDGNMIYSGAISGYSSFAIWLGTTQITKGSKYFLMHVDVENNKLLYMANSTPHIVSFTGTTVDSDTASDITINYWCVCCTGLNEGDYVVVMPKNTTSTNNYCFINSSTTILGQSATTYQVYRISSDNKLIAANEDDVLATYTSLTKSIWHWDSRNNLLTIGTTDNVYVLEWNSSTKTWAKVLSDFPLPTNTTGSIYNATISPSKTRMVVYVGDMSVQNQNIFIYDINTNKYTWTVVKNVIPNYDSTLAFTGTFGGTMIEAETGESYAVVNITLPGEATVECSLESDYEPELSMI